MKYSNRSFERTLILFAFATLSVLDAFSQQWVVDEIAEENEGGPFSGILGTLLFFGIIWFLGTIFDKKKKNSTNNKPSQGIYHNDSAQDKYIDDNIDLDYMMDDLHDDSLFVSSSHSTKTSKSSTNKSISSPVDRNVESFNDKDFKERCIKIYGDYAEYTYGLVLIKEDGDYRQISHPDKRYDILVSYLYEHHNDRYCAAYYTGNAEMLMAFIEYHKKFKIFPEAKSMENHGKLEKEFLGEQIVMLMAYYLYKQYPIYTSRGNSLKDYCLSLGFDMAIYLHKYIEQPMGWEDYYYLKDMDLHGMNKDEYLAFRSKVYNIVKGEDGYYDGLGERIGNTFEEAHEMIQSRFLISYEQAMAEVKQIEWHL